MALKVIGAGFGRTGTASLKTALEQLGFGHCCPMYELGAHPEHMGYWGGDEVQLLLRNEVCVQLAQYL